PPSPTTPSLPDPLPILTTSQFANLEEIRNTVVAVEGQTPLRLQDIAEVREGVEDRRTLITGNGQPAALINISRQIGGNILQIAGDRKSTRLNSSHVAIS